MEGLRPQTERDGVRPLAAVANDSNRPGMSYRRFIVGYRIAQIHHVIDFFKKRQGRIHLYALGRDDAIDLVPVQNNIAAMRSWALKWRRTNAPDSGRASAPYQRLDGGLREVQVAHAPIGAIKD